MVQTKIRDIIYNRYSRATNMSLSELLNWKVNPLSKLASLSRKPINLAIRLKRKRRGEWELRDYRLALKAISYLRRAKKIKGGVRGKAGYTKNEIALKNWGYDIKKTRR